MKLLASLLFTLLLLTYSMPVQGQAITPDQVRNLMDERDQQIKSLLGPEGSEFTEEQRDELRSIINDIIDYDAMARIALQDTYNSITVDQRTEFVNLFGSIIRDQSLNNLDIYRAEVIYDDIVVDSNKASVKTTAVLRNVRTNVSYEVEKRGEDWFITDMAIDNVSTAESYRRSFQNMIRRRGFDALLQNLRNRAAS